MNAKKLLAVLLITVMIFVAAYPSHAHYSTLANIFDTFTREGKTYVGTEAIGWLLLEGQPHTNDTTLTYAISSEITANYPSLVTAIDVGANKCTNPFSVSHSPTPTGLIELADNLPSGILARAVPISYNSNYHISSWRIRINNKKTPSVTSVTIAHEFGHVFGLADLKYASNTNKLMYFSEERTATAPTTMDIKGAKTITGYHSTHTWSYVQVLNIPKHKHYCTVCGGYKTQYCTFNSSHICTYCGAPDPNYPSGTGTIPAALLPDPDEQRKVFITVLS